MKGFGVGKHKKKYQFTAQDVADIYCSLKTCVRIEKGSPLRLPWWVDLDGLLFYFVAL
jgi:hypothetical protein